MSDFKRVKHYFNRCNPEIPIPENDPDSFYVDFDLKELRGEKCIDALAARIELSDGPTTQLFTGFPGAGKTSELYRLVKKLNDLDYLVVYADSLNTIDVLNPIEYTDVLIALGLAVDEELSKLYKQGKTSKWVKRFGNELKKLLFADVSLHEFKGKIGIESTEIEIGAELKKSPSFRRGLRQAANNQRRQFLDQVRNFFYDADQSIRKVYKQGLVVILDNLEKLSSEADTRDSARNMLLHHSDALRQPNVHLIYTIPAPFIFSVWGPQLGRIYNSEPLVLPMVKIRRQSSGSLYQDGIKAMREALLRRVDFDEVFSGDEEIVEKLIEHCGGYTRDLLRLLQYSLQNAWELPVRAEHVDMAIRKLEKSYRRGLNTDDFPLLQGIKENRPQTVSEESKKRLEQIMTNHYVMIYGNDTEWYDIHPLVGKFIGNSEAG
ncbi:MAG: hypothetical protein GY861_04815 [bacterium]|nr:hypothetical protein [bacterium]